MPPGQLDPEHSDQPIAVTASPIQYTETPARVEYLGSGRTGSAKNTTLIAKASIAGSNDHTPATALQEVVGPREMTATHKSEGGQVTDEVRQIRHAAIEVGHFFFARAPQQEYRRPPCADHNLQQPIRELLPAAILMGAREARLHGQDTVQQQNPL